MNACDVNTILVNAKAKKGELSVNYDMCCEHLQIVASDDFEHVVLQVSFHIFPANIWNAVV